jgi:antitoxin component of MazEF toxin-antitoxin module
MTVNVQITKMGKDAVVVLSDEILKNLGVEIGEELAVSAVAENIVLSRPKTETRAEKLARLTQEIFEENRESLKALAEGAK